MRFVTDLSKGILGKPDSAEMWQEIIANIPDEVFLKEDLKILNIAFGHATEADVIVKRMLSLGRTPEEIKNSIYLLDKYSVFTKDAKRKGYANIIQADFINWETNMKFDVIVGNPPYQNNHKKDADSKRKVGNKLWYQFIFKADNLVKKDGYVAMVSPNQWLTGGVNMRKGSMGVLKDIFAKKQLLTATVSGITQKYFKGIGISIGWWVYQNSPITKKTRLNLDSSTMFIDFNGLEFLSPEANEESIGIVTKTLLAQNDKFETYYFNSQCKPDVHKETEHPTTENIYPHWIMGSNVTNNLVLRYFPKVLNERVNYKKIVFPMSTRYWQPYLTNKDTSVASLGQALKVDDAVTQQGFESVFYSKLFKYICFNLQIAQNGFMKTVLVKALPRLDMSKVWTDSQLYSHFNLTQTEIDYIENVVK